MSRHLWPAAAAIAVAAGAAIPTGRALGQWAVFGDLSLSAELARYWIAIPGAVVLAAALGLWLRATRRALRLAAPVLLALLLGLGAWQGVADRVNAFREGPLNDAL